MKLCQIHQVLHVIATELEFAHKEMVSIFLEPVEMSLTHRFKSVHCK